MHDTCIGGYNYLRIFHCRNKFFFFVSGECSIRVIDLLEYHDLEHLSMAIILGTAITVH